MKYYSPTGRRNHGRPMKRLLDTWDRNGSTSGPTPWKIYDDEIPTYKHIVDIFIWLPLDWHRAILQKVANNGIQHEHFCSQCLAVNTACFRRPGTRQFHFTCCRMFWCCVPLSNDICKMLSVLWCLAAANTDTDCHDSVIWSVAQRGTAACRLYVDHWPLSLVRGQKLSPWPGTQISIFKMTPVAQHTRECNFVFVDMQSSFPNFTQTCQEVSNVAQ